MGETLGEYAICQTIEDYKRLPLYYYANCKIIMSFMIIINTIGYPLELSLY